MSISFQIISILLLSTSGTLFAQETRFDMGLNEWIKMKIVVKNAQARLYLNDNPQPVLVVNDLKLGAANSGAIGLFVDGGTDGYFRDIKVRNEN